MFRDFKEQSRKLPPPPKIKRPGHLRFPNLGNQSNNAETMTIVEWVPLASTSWKRIITYAEGLRE